MNCTLLVVYYSQQGSTSAMARLIARGINSINQCEAVIRCVPPVSALTHKTQANIPDHGEPYATLDDLKQCDGLALGSPSYYGGIAAPLKTYIDSTTPLWLSGQLAGKPACVFTSSGSYHGGQEMVLFSLMVPLFHHGMLLTGLPYTEASLNKTITGGTPYGASHVAGDNHRGIDENEKNLCFALGKRLAQTALKLKSF